MNTIHGRIGRTRGSSRALRLCALLVSLLPLGGCGGGHGASGSSGGTSPVKVLSISPAKGTFIGGSALTITGEKFLTPNLSANVVLLGGLACTDVVTVDDATITCVSPAGTPGAKVDVEVTNELGTGRLVNGFEYLLPIPPRSDVNGDGIADLIVGAAGDDTVGPGAGAVYVRFGSTNLADLIDGTTADADVRIFGLKAGDGFGTAVASGDVDHDGIDDICVGAPGWDGLNAVDAGCVYVFLGPRVSGESLSAAGADVKLTGDTQVAGDAFGSCVDLGDLDGDLQLEVLASATRHDQAPNGNGPTLTDVGCVYLFGGSASLSNLSADQAPAQVEGIQQNQRLGDSLSCGDLDGDLEPDLLVGSMGGDPLLPPVLQQRGRVYCLRGGPSLMSSLLQVDEAPVLITGDELDDQFGAVTRLGDLDGDGAIDLLVAAPLNDYYGADFGRVFLFRGGDGLAGGLAADADAKVSGLYSHNSLGSAMAVGDADGDFIQDLVLGAPQASNLNEGDGRIYVFRGRAGFADCVATDAVDTYCGEPNLADGFGRAVALVDLNGDGLADVVGSSTYNDGGTGRVYVFFWTGTHGERMAAAADMKLSGTSLQQGLGSSIAAGQ